MRIIRLMMTAVLLATLLLHPKRSMLMAQSQISVANHAVTVTMHSFLNKARPLLVFSPDNLNPNIRRQREIFASGQADMHVRQVVFVPVMEHDSIGSAEDLPKRDDVRLTKEEATSLRKRLQISAVGFTVVLIGKDGGEKFRANTPVTIEKLNAVIDAMPMRKQEVKNGDAK